MTRPLGILLGGVALVVVIITAISLIGGYLEERVHGERQAPMQTLMLKDGGIITVYDIAITGQPCLLLRDETGIALSCDWTH